MEASSTCRGRRDGHPSLPLDTTARGNGRSGRRDGLQSNQEMGPKDWHQVAPVTSPILNSEEARKSALSARGSMRRASTVGSYYSSGGTLMSNIDLIPEFGAHLKSEGASCASNLNIGSLFRT